MRLLLVLVTFVYIQAGYLTGSYYNNHRCFDYKNKYHKSECGLDTMLVGIGWPSYWNARFADWVTGPPTVHNNKRIK